MYHRFCCLPLLAVLIIKVLFPMLADVPAAAPQATVVSAYGPYNTCRCCLSFSALPCLPLMLIAASQAKASAKRATQLRCCCLSFCTILCLPHMRAAALQAVAAFASRPAPPRHTADKRGPPPAPHSVAVPTPNGAAAPAQYPGARPSPFAAADVYATAALPRVQPLRRAVSTDPAFARQLTGAQLLNRFSRAPLFEASGDEEFRSVGAPQVYSDW